MNNVNLLPTSIRLETPGYGNPVRYVRPEDVLDIVNSDGQWSVKVKVTPTGNNKDGKSLQADVEYLTKSKNCARELNLVG